MKMTEKEALVALNLVDGIGSIRMKVLLERFGTALGVFNASHKELREVKGINGELISCIAKIKDSPELKKELDLIKKEGINVLTINDADYPQNLKQIYDPPVVLYVKGKILSCDNLAISIVGSRRASFYGLAQAERLASELVSLGITVVSGLARGIDTKAHQGALRAKGRTLAVLGSGLRVIYPPENNRLSMEIEKCGAVISEFPLNTKPLARNFPYRNRIISGLSLGVVVVEAARNSGALITARLGLEQGREIFSLPGRIDSRSSFGTNQLIKEGAKLLNSIDDILEELRPHLKEGLKKKQEDRESKTDTKDKLPAKLNPEQASILNNLSDQPLHIEDIVKITNLNLETVLVCLLQLELKQLIRQLPGKFFIKAKT